MSKLQKSAWFNLIMVTVFTIVALVNIFLLARHNAKGIDYLIVCFLVGAVATPSLYILHKKKGIESKFDEREKTINRRAFLISAFGLVAFLFAACIIPFFVMGGQNVIKVVYLPVIFFSSLFAAQFVQSMAIIIQCAMEEDDGQ
jgi:hypothetical protein